MSCSRTHRSDASEARTRGPSVSSQELSQRATALPSFVIQMFLHCTQSNFNQNVSTHVSASVHILFRSIRPLGRCLRPGHTSNRIIVPTIVAIVRFEHPCADPGIFVRGGDKKSSYSVFFFFFCFFFSPQLILQKSNGQFQRNL